MFEILRSEKRRLDAIAAAEAERGILAFSPQQADALARTLFPTLEEGGFCTHLVTGRSAWNPRSSYFEAARQAAARGRRIQRAFLLPHRYCRHDPSLWEHIALDKAAGIEVLVVHVGELISERALPQLDSLNFGIWDDTIAHIGLHTEHAENGDVGEWRVTCREEDLQALRQAAALILDRGDVLNLDGEVTEGLDLEEPMITTAPLAHQLARVLCRGDHVSPGGCGWYHSVWQYLRILDVVSTPTWHARFYFDALGKLAANEACREIAITGTADYSMLAHVLWAFRNRRPPPNISVIDLCETPLFLCKWYGKTAGVAVETFASDVLKFVPQRPYDIITSDAFITRFSGADKVRVVMAWNKMLRLGGHVVSTARIEPSHSGGPIESSGDQIRDFERRVAREARTWQAFLGTRAEEIAALARSYATNMVSHSFESRAELESLLVGNGFDMRQIDIADVPGEMKGTTYAEFHVQKVRENQELPPATGRSAAK